ncbi:transposase [Porticoccus sp. W117]|uniref:IS66-like element accessory protein TnpA n=1 Tax=Porticoccus sp. W117 TaxID=3054777 RepID=UPI00259A0A4A|nr:transposase [Porticoccus sp. W117]MDM3872683.1 transposase [Porticoccus sp. W117]
MDTLSGTSLSFPASTNTKRRRRFTPEFRAKVVALCKQPDASVAAIARQHGLNANLVHKWIRGAGKSSSTASSPSTDFLPIPVSAPLTADQCVRIEINNLSIHWPIAHIHQAVPWLKALQS